jgi:hypothetical protein
MKRIFLLAIIAFSATVFAQQPRLPDCSGAWSNSSWNNCYGILSYGVEKKYIGDFKDEYPHGSGKFFYADGAVFKGEVFRGKRQGKGELQYASGDRYVGEFFEDVMDGEGVFYSAVSKGRYEGSFKDNNFNGYGTYFYADGGKYVGSWKDSLKNGKGIEYNSKGRVEFNGMFENDLRQ